MKLSEAQYAALAYLANYELPSTQRVISTRTISTPRPNTLRALEILGLIHFDGTVAGNYVLTPAGRKSIQEH